MATRKTASPRKTLPKEGGGEAAGAAPAAFHPPPLAFQPPPPPPVPVRYGRVTTLDAMRMYALSRAEVMALPHRDERNAVFGVLTAPTHVFDHAVLRRAAEAKWAAKGTSLAAVLALRDEMARDAEDVLRRRMPLFLLVQQHAAPRQVVSAIAGRATGTSRTSAWNCIKSALAVMPPSALSSLSGWPESAAMASTTSRVCQATASSAARAMWPRVT